MHYYHFQEVDSEVTARTTRPQGTTGLGKPQGLTNGGPNAQSSTTQQSLLAGKGLAHGDQTSPGQIGLQTEFNNDTDEKQTYTFQFEKVRTASVEVSYQKGFSIGTKANFSIGLPKVMGDGSIGAEVDKHLEVTKSTGERFEESLKTSATSDIVVSERSRYIASVVMEEKQLLANFKTVVEMTMPAGRAPIYVRNLKTGEYNYVRTIRNLPSAFKGFSKDVVSPVLNAEGKTRSDAVRFTVHGIIDGVQLSTHKIHLHKVPALTQRDKEDAQKTHTKNPATGKEELIEF
ncbi:uncharacterized protein LOC143275317 isoform X2 [Babylonia areolata]